MPCPWQWSLSRRMPTLINKLEHRRPVQQPALDRAEDRNGAQSESLSMRRVPNVDIGLQDVAEVLVLELGLISHPGLIATFSVGWAVLAIAPSVLEEHVT